jgi:phosphoribosylamine--glycine ligase
VTPSRILVLGSGGREHALAWRLAADAHRPEVLLAPGNDGAGREFERLGVRETDAAGVVAAARERAVELVVVGPEAALAAGVADALLAAGIPVFGAVRDAARLESSKWFAKDVMRAANVPTARAEVFEEPGAARAALARFGPPWVVKADGLAAGKGVLVTADAAAASAFVSECLEGGRFGEGGRRVVLEEFLPGEEATVIAICDGERHVLLPTARDYKRAYDGDAGPNTGGMGAYAPAHPQDANLERTVSERVVTPVLRELAARGTPYRGALYCGLMLGEAGPRVVEFNARFGDPETQVLMPLVGGSFGDLLAGAAAGVLDPDALVVRPGAAVAVALVDEGYPDGLRGGGRLEHLDEAARRCGTFVFHAGTKCGEDGGWTVTGGRAAYVVATGEDTEAARVRAYECVGQVGGAGWRCRSDVGRAVASAGRRQDG